MSHYTPDPYRLEFGLLWVRTERTVHELDLLGGDLARMAALADRVNGALERRGNPIRLLPNGWASVPTSKSPTVACNSIDSALAVVFGAAAA